MPRSAIRLFSFCLFFGLLFFCFSIATFAETTQYKSANTITTDGNPSYTNLSNCSLTDGLTCDRSFNLSYANLYFQNFGDFGIPIGATITGVKIRVTGKTDISTYAGASVLGTIQGIPFPANCTTPSDKWTMSSLVNQNIQTYSVTSTSGVDFITCLNASNIRSNNFIFRINRAGPTAWSASIDNLEIAFDYNPAPTPTPSPAITPSPTSTPPAPFLDLPWDYSGKGLSFSDAALNINTFFDHEYPLLSATQLIEPDFIISFNKPYKIDDFYTSHDGYDYGKKAKANYDDPVLAAASGIATYINTCGACGNAIHVNHENGYQTRYYHLQKDGLIINTPGQPIPVNAGQEIGKIGATGNVDPPGEAGAHIHFMVIQDKNKDGNFEDNIPDGLTDPFGWQSQKPDPWENYSFFYKGEQRTGNKSFYLWNKNIDNLKSDLTSNGGVFNSGKTKVTFPENFTSQNILLSILSTPAKEFSNLISSLGSTVQILANDSSGNEINTFNNPFTLEIDFSNQDLSRFLTDTLSIYSSSDGIDWIKEPTNIDYQNQKATSSISHLTHFALMAERKDVISATTTANLIGEQGDLNWFRSDVSVSLSTVDNPGGLGVNYILYKKDSDDWLKYISPINFTTDGDHTLAFYSVDNDENIEEIKKLAFTIDKTPPEAEIYYSLNSKNLDFYGKDGPESAIVTTSNSGGNNKIIITDKAGNKLTIIAKTFTGNILSWINILSIQYNNDAPIIPAKNNFLITPIYNRANQLSSVGEIYSVKDKNLLGAIYSTTANKTKIYTYNKSNKQILKEEKLGDHLLKLYTESATLKYRY